MRIGDFKESYAADEAVFSTSTSRFWLGVLFLLLAVFPFIAGEYLLYMANITGIAIVAALGLNILTGAAGQISLGHAAFVGIGAYTAAILANRFGLPFLLCLPLAGLAAAFFGVLVGAPSMRMKGLYLCITTLAAQVIFEFFFVHWESLTGGIRGLNIAPPTIHISHNLEEALAVSDWAAVLDRVSEDRTLLEHVKRCEFDNKICHFFIPHSCKTLC